MVPPEWLRPRGWPAHVWLGTTVENNAEATKRIPTLLDVPAAVRFLSCEPLLGPVDLAYALFNGADSFGTMPGIHWVIAGGESGGGARSAHPEWARSLRDQCRAANVPFFFKQWGEWAPMGQTAHEGFKRLHDFGDGQFMERVGKAAAGRKLDGLEWSEMPGMTAAERLAAVSPQLAPRRT